MSCTATAQIFATATLAGMLGIPLLSAQPAAAVSLTWTLSGVTFSDGVLLSGVTYNDGGPASGYFDYDADTNQYSNINIATGDAYTYHQLGSLSDPQSPSDSQNLYLFREKTALYEPFSSALAFQFAQPLINAAGPSLVSLAAVTEERITRGPGGLDIETRALVPGSSAFVSASAQPVPEPVSAIGAGFAGVAAYWMKKRRSSIQK